MGNKFIVGSVIVSVALIIAGCGGQEVPAPKKQVFLETVEIDEGDQLYYLDVIAAEASSFDESPDWAPEPDPMAPVDGNILSRWSSGYELDPEWIYFDLGRESVVSNVIIRWERAYAAKYAVQASLDSENWQDVYVEENGQGGMEEMSFKPVKCRYLRILGVEKANEQWGISMWEVEIYGPKSYNPDAEVSKEEYLSEDEEEAMRKEADELIESLSAPVVSLSEQPFQQGVVYTSWEAGELLKTASDLTLASLKEMGYDSVAIMVPAYQEELESDTVYTNDREGGDTPTDEDIVHAIQTCHKLGLRVMMKVHVDPRTDEPRLNILANEKWFDSYRDLMVRYAKLSQENGVEMFSVGTELEATTFERWTEHWLDVIAKIKEVYDGALTYSANHSEYQGVPFWNEMDFIGIDAYFPLTSSDEPAYEELVAAWEKHANDIENWLNENGLTEKGVIFTEIGYTSTDGTNRQPWAPISKREDQQEQADCLAATFQVMSARPWFKGYYIWEYKPQERWSPEGFTINKKKAEETMKEWIKKMSELKKQGGVT